MACLYIQRALEEKILETSATFRVVLVTGPRQVGKTTLLKKLSSAKRSYVSLDDPSERYIAKTDPALFMQRHKPPVLIDEIQYAPELLPYIKMCVDDSNERGKYWITGSQVFHLMKNVSESLAGRVGILNLQGLSNSEINNVPSVLYTTDPNRLMNRSKAVPKMSLATVYDRIFKGSMPELWANKQVDWERYYSSYVDTYLHRDVRDLTQVGDEMTFFDL